MKARLYLILCLLIVAILLLSACAAPTVEEPAAEEPAAEEPAAPEAEEEEPAAAEPVTLSLWHWETPPHRVEALQIWLDRYETETGVTVEQVPINFPDYQTKILAAIAADVLPEMILINPPHLPLIESEGAILSVDDLFADLHEQYEFFEAAANIYNMDGLQYGIPIYGVYWPMVYRPDLLEEAGLDVPKTWDDFLTVTKELTKDTDGDGVADVYGFCMPVSANGNYGSQMVWGNLRSGGGDVVNVADGEETIVFNSPETIRTYEYLAQLAEYAPPGADNADWGSTELLIKAGKCGTVMFTGSWLGELHANDPDLAAKYRMTDMPWPEDGTNIHTGYPRALVITKAAEANSAAVEAFVRWLYEPANHAEMLMAEPALLMPVDVATAESDAFWAYPMNNQYRNLVEEQARVGQTLQVIGFTGPEPAPHASQIESSFTLAKVLQKIVIEGLSPEDAVAWGEQQYLDIISQ
jgi:multiple sugar transport system substrate-binding protein